MNQTNAVSSPEESPSSILAELVDELAAQAQAGERVDLEGVLRAHPEHAAELRRLWDALGALHDLSGSAEEQLAGVASLKDGVVGPGAGVLGDFRLLGEIGRGGMGVVYEAEQVSLRRRVAVKVLSFAAALDARQLQRFKNEALAAAQLHHTHIVPVYFVGCERGVHFYAMQYVEGQSLAAVIAERRELEARQTGNVQPDASPLSADTVDPAAGRAVAAASAERGALQGALSTVRSAGDSAWFRKVAELGAQAAEALEHAHQQGVIHRDVKPANLLVDGHGHLWVADFGLAQVQNDPRLTITGDLVGTLRYVSPEQALAKRGLVDHRTDVYSLGATLYELLTLKPAFPGTDRQELLRQIAFEEPCPPRRLNKAVPKELEEAELLNHQVVEVRRRAQGVGNGNTATANHTLAELLYSQGRSAEAEPLFREAIKNYLLLGLKSRRHAPAAMQGLAFALKDQGKLAEAESFAKEAIQILRQLRPEDHADGLVTLGAILTAAGKAADAEPLLRKGLKIHRAVLPTNTTALR
jgi:serine/threonine protein kinase